MKITPEQHEIAQIAMGFQKTNELAKRATDALKSFMLMSFSDAYTLSEKETLKEALEILCTAIDRSNEYSCEKYIAKHLQDKK